MATKALALDETLPGAHNALAAVRFNEYDWAGAEKEFKRAIELNPSYVPAHLWHGYFLEALGQQSANLAERRLGQELDPLNLAAGTGVGTAYFYLGQYDRAIEEQRKTLELNPGFDQALVNLGEVYEAKGMYADAIVVYGKAGASGSLGHAYAASGKKAEARKILRELDEQSVPCRPDDPGVVLLDFGVGYFSSKCRQRSQRTLLVRSHKTREAHHIGGEDGGETAD